MFVECNCDEEVEEDMPFEPAVEMQDMDLLHVDECEENLDMEFESNLIQFDEPLRQADLDQK
jgi:hypothetical protein